MTRRSRIPREEWQYGDRSSAEIRSTLLELAREFVRAAIHCAGVARVAVLGSILTTKERPKDIDLLVTITPAIDLPALATLSRRLKGGAQSRLNSGADVFLADVGHHHLGRICHYRECHRRVLCHARHCGAVPHLNDDLDALTLDRGLIAAPPLELYPAVVVRAPIPGDVERLLVAPMRQLARPDGQR